MSALRITRGLRIPEDELQLRFARSGGPGGQHVNTSATKVEVRFDVAGSPSLSDAQRERITAQLGNRMTADGVLVLSASEHRSQTRNRKAALGRLQNLLREALRPRRQRKPTTPSRAAKERRLAAKRHQAERKALRKPPPLP